MAMTAIGYTRRTGADRRRRPGRVPGVVPQHPVAGPAAGAPL